MTPRYGLLVQLCQLLAQLFLDWCNARDKFDEPFTFIVPGECVTGLEDEHVGVLVTISPIKKHETQVCFDELSVAQSVRSTIGNKDYRPPPYPH